MGLDTSHNCWHGSYGGFALWRNEIAKAAGWTNRTTTPRGTETYEIPRENTEDRLYGWWGFGQGPDDAIDVLLMHSDCEGYIFPWNAEALADRLALLDLSQAEEWISDARDLFVAGLRAAYEEYEIVVFR